MPRAKAERYFGLTMCPAQTITSNPTNAGIQVEPNHARKPSTNPIMGTHTGERILRLLAQLPNKNCPGRPSRIIEQGRLAPWSWTSILYNCYVMVHPFFLP